MEDNGDSVFQAELLETQNLLKINSEQENLVQKVYYQVQRLAAEYVWIITTWNTFSNLTCKPRHDSKFGLPQIVVFGHQK